MRNKAIAVFLMMLMMSVLLAGCGGVKTESGGDKSSTGAVVPSETTQSAERDASVKGSEENESNANDELSSEARALAQRLLEQVQKAQPAELIFYDVRDTPAAVSGYRSIEAISKFVDVQPFARKTGEKEIQQFRDSLKLQKWEAKRFSVKSLPGMMIYFDKNLHVNLETEHEGIFWMSVHSPQGSAYFSVPSSVYTGLTQLSGYKPS